MTSTFSQDIIDLGDINNGSSVLDPFFDLTTINHKNSHNVAQRIVKIELLEMEDVIAMNSKQRPYGQFIYRDLEAEIMQKKAPAINNNFDAIMR